MRPLSIAFKSPDIGKINFCLVKSVATLLKYITPDQSYPFCLELMYWHEKFHQELCNGFMKLFIPEYIGQKYVIHTYM